MMLASVDESAYTTWAGLQAQDPFGEPLGTIIETLRDRATGAPEWLLIEGDDGKPRLAPLPRALLTGRKVRVAATADAVRSAPELERGMDLDLERKQLAAEHYGLELDTDHSSSGQLRAPSTQRGESERAEERSPSASQRQAIVARLAAAHAMEQASLKLLAAMRRRVEDEELVHDLALHHRATRRHAERVRLRLDALGSPRARPLDRAAKTWAAAQAQLGRLRSTPEPYDLRSAYEFEQREIAAYEELERLAASVGDTATSEACRANRLDEIAFAAVLQNSRLWRDPGLRRGESSSFEAPTAEQQIAPRS
jgi:ferritin-like metal-binding protein YciE